MQLNNNSGLRAPAPIFNYRKRPRQAVTADPPSVMTGPSGDASFSNSELMPIGGFQRQQTPVHQMPSRTTAAGQRNNSSNNNRSSNLQIANHVASQPRFPTNNRTQNHAQHTESNTHTNQNIGVYKSSGPFQKNPPNNSVPQTSGPQTNPRNQFNFRNNVGQKTPDSVSMAHGSKNQMLMGPMLQPEDMAEWDNDSEFSAMQNIDKPSTHRASKPQMTSSRHTSSGELEKSTHFITCDVQDVQCWASFKDKVPVLLETYGYLNSTISRAVGDCKEFIIRDEKNASIKCVFYEIDREFPKVTRGQCYRLVGTYDLDKQHFRCLSLRAPSENERKMAATLAKKSSLSMSKLTREVREP